MTPAPISVERLREVVAFLLGEGHLDGHSFGDGFAPLVAGKYPAAYWWRTQLREQAEALPALLHQLAELERKASNRHAQVIESDAMCADLRDKLAERDAEVDRLKAQAEEDRELRMDVERQWNQMMGQLEAAERAREEFRLLASLRLFHAPTIGYCWFERCGVSWTGKAHATINEANAENPRELVATPASGGSRDG